MEKIVNFKVGEAVTVTLPKAAYRNDDLAGYIVAVTEVKSEKMRILTVIDESDVTYSTFVFYRKDDDVTSFKTIVPRPYYPETITSFTAVADGESVTVTASVTNA